ncbi:hypothetical protein LZP69_09380 [Shewanella sp. AS1]|uniref:hypothetical protein n=1 Tax=Shewanella sp. AS1 TaxID=2907626 RepID=UPI001F2509ED|nr:hypothetical protein [Shewanella sp. AS1]MCE9679384.1 hypothetical protein [Shewanella sp. AS1]
MSISNDKILNSVNLELLKFISLFQDNSFRYLFESDVQCELLSRLRQAIPGTLKIPGLGKPLQEYNISIVNSEYLNRIDIACLDIDKAAYHEMRNHKGFDMHLYDIPVYAGIEIKFRKIGDIFRLDSCLRDLEKLQKLNIPNPIILGFIQLESDVEAFFSHSPANICYTQVDKDTPLSTVNIISPKRRWAVNAI